MPEDKECFFISPIGEDGSEVRDRSDKLLEYVIKDALSEFGYSVTRADQMDTPGSITNQVISKTVESDLVIADLTNHNPNVFYELAVRHATGEPFIQMIDSTESIPFDIADLRTIQYGLGVEEADQAKEEIRSHIEALEEEEPEYDNPISRSAEMQSLQESTDPTDQNLAEVLQRLALLDRKIEELQQGRRNQVKLADLGGINEKYRLETEGQEIDVEGPKVSPAYIEKQAHKHGLPVAAVRQAVKAHPELEIVQVK